MPTSIVVRENNPNINVEGRVFRIIYHSQHDGGIKFLISVICPSSSHLSIGASQEKQRAQSGAWYTITMVVLFQ